MGLGRGVAVGLALRIDASAAKVGTGVKTGKGCTGEQLLVIKSASNGVISNVFLILSVLHAFYITQYDISIQSLFRHQTPASENTNPAPF